LKEVPVVQMVGFLLALVLLLRPQAKLEVEPPVQARAQMKKGLLEQELWKMKGKTAQCTMVVESVTFVTLLWALALLRKALAVAAQHDQPSLSVHHLPAKQQSHRQPYRYGDAE
jgi:23S rRNA A1618 N6-methylase RlmF